LLENKLCVFELDNKITCQAELAVHKHHSCLTASVEKAQLNWHLAST